MWSGNFLVALGLISHSAAPLALVYILGDLSLRVSILAIQLHLIDEYLHLDVQVCHTRIQLLRRLVLICFGLSGSVFGARRKVLISRSDDRLLSFSVCQRCWHCGVWTQGVSRRTASTALTRGSFAIKSARLLSGVEEILFLTVNLRYL